MLFRKLSPNGCQKSPSAYQEFLKTQSAEKPPFGILFQSEHSRLAGALAQALQPHVFGELNADVIAAIAHHDYGWDKSDQQQVHLLAERTPAPFTEISAEDTLPCWISSIAHGRQLGPLAAVLISRHCCLLGTGSGKHADFIRTETIQRQALERALPHSAEDLDRWTGALGFCDLLSLYLCSGSDSTVTFPLAHPERAEGRPSITLEWVNGQINLSQDVIQGAHLHAEGLLYTGKESKPEPLSLRWSFNSSPAV